MKRILVAAPILACVVIAGSDCSDFVASDLSGAPVENAASTNDAEPTNKDKNVSELPKTPAPDVKEGLAVATFGSGCFWCTEAVFQRLEGVETVTSGYSGGHVENPTYEQICGKKTGHAEVTQIVYNPKVISFKELLEVFWKTHDPTTPNQQGNDVGPQYRSAVFYHSEEQKELAQKYKKNLDEAGAFRAPIVTEITEFTNFYPAEDYHQNYFNLNPRQGYCTFVIAPKVEKFKAAFADKLKDE